ncbi:MAG: hypothetical protein KAY24_10345 [Candidatus Eisenbacteria sp.]|nr:hypothetical protein [Candidatus Eisenbacteria bacterium]
MESDQSEHLYTILFDERQESWYIRLDDSHRFPLSRVSLQHLVSLYNDIHRGGQLTLIDRRAMEELGKERTELHETIHSLYDYIDTEAESRSAALNTRARSSFSGLFLHLFHRVGRWFSLPFLGRTVDSEND